MVDSRCLQANVDRTRAHVLRMKSARDVTKAHHDLNKVEVLDLRLQRIARAARAKREAFKRNTARTKALQQEAALLKSKATKVMAQLSAMEKQVFGSSVLQCPFVPRLHH